MALHTITIIPCDHEALVGWMGSTRIAEVEYASPTDPDELRHLELLGSRAYTRDEGSWESPDAPELIRAFRRVCEHVGGPASSIEAYEDEEETLTLWNLVWSEWDGTDVLELPLSPHGVPAVTWHGPQKVLEFLSEFTDASIPRNAEFLSDQQLRSLLAALSNASKRGLGVFVFVEY